MSSSALGGHSSHLWQGYSLCLVGRRSCFLFAFLAKHTFAVWFVIWVGVSVNGSVHLGLFLSKLIVSCWRAEALSAEQSFV